MIRNMTRLVGVRRHTTAIVWALPAALLVTNAFLMVFGDGLDLIDFVVLSISISIPFSVVGAIIVSRQPRHVVGWVMWTIGGSSALQRFLEGYGQVSLHGAMLAGSGTARAIAVRGGFLAPILCLTLLPLLFPTGRLLSPRWRWIVWLAVASMLVMFIPSAIFLWFHRQEFVTIYNPQPHVAAAIDRTFAIGALGSFIAAIASCISVVVRVRRSSGVERQQMKWFLAGVTSEFVGILALFFASWHSDINAIAVAVLPVTIGVAILRYDLYDIDHLINRALVYSTLTATLVGADIFIVIALEHLLNPIASGSDLIVAGSTLAVAALIRPLRSRIQKVVDRRFYRRKYDAARTLETFSVRLRDEIDLDALTAALQATVVETMQPAHVSVWLTKTARSRSS
jgi:hypothetical protein